MAEGKTLELTWKISDFLPGLENLGEVTEYITPETINENDNISYWDVPEVLLNIRWVHEVVGYYDTFPVMDLLKEDNVCDKQITQIQELTKFLQSWALGFYKSNQAIEKIRKEKEEFILYWEKYKRIILSVRKGRLVSDKENRHLSDAAQELILLANGSASKYTLLQKAFHKAVKSAKELQSDPAEMKYIDFSRFVYSFYSQYLFQKEEKEAGETIRFLDNSIRQLLSVVGKKTNMPRANKWDTTYRNAVWNGLQQLATEACSGKQRIVSFHSPSELVTRVTQKMNEKGVSEKLIRAYEQQNCKEKRKRCIAMLDANDHAIQIMALSGFLDCDDSDLEEYRKKEPNYRNSQSFLEKIQQICAELNQIELAYFSTAVVDKYLCYPTETSIEHDYLRTVLQDKTKWAIIGKNQACCERKILAKLESENRAEDIQSGSLIIKRSPCKRCEIALESWEAYSKIKVIHN